MTTSQPRPTDLPPATATLLPGLKAFNIPTTSDTTIFTLTGGSGPPLLLLHGYPQTHLIFHKVLPQLLPHFTCILIDLRGYGLSFKSRTSDASDASDHNLYAKSALAADCIAVMDALGYAGKQFSVCGHDRGGRVAHSLSIRYPERVKRVMVLDIVPTLAMFRATDRALATAYWHWFFLSQPAPFPEQAILAAPQVFAEKQLTRMLQGRKREEMFVDEAWEEYCKLFRDEETVHAMCEDYRAGAKEDCEEQEREESEGRKIKCPLMCLWGKLGVVEKAFDAKKEWEKVCEEGMWDDRSEAVEGGHYVPEEQPEVLARHMLAFFLE